MEMVRNLRPQHIRLRAEDKPGVLVVMDRRRFSAGVSISAWEGVKNMVEVNQVYKCGVCGNIVEVLHAGVGELVCCGEPMKLMKENTVDASREKHVPVIEKTTDGIKAKVGSEPHPMEEKHYIEWVEVIADGRVYRKHLRPGEAPEVEFEIAAAEVTARELCNVHGLWKS
jgi:superoxide reductase